jgi:RNA polymerase sigma-70 factor (ECF subfamily)
MIDLQEFIGKHERALTNFALQLTRNEDDADDLLQDTWLKCLAHQNTLENMTEQKQRSWLFTVLKNRWLDVCRHRKLERMHASQSVSNPAAPFSSLHMEVHLDKLPPLEQRIVKQKYWMDMNSRQIAAELGIPEGTVRWRLKLALEKLKESVEQSQKEEKCLL